VFGVYFTVAFFWPLKELFDANNDDKKQLNKLQVIVQQQTKQPASWNI